MARVHSGKRAVWMTSRKSHTSPATDVEVSTLLLCADLNKKNVTTAPKWDKLHICVGQKRQTTRYVKHEAETSLAEGRRKICVDWTLQSILRFRWLLT